MHSGENNRSRVVGTRHAGQAQMCQGPWQQSRGERGGNSQAANLPPCGLSSGHLSSTCPEEGGALVISAADRCEAEC